MIINYIISLTNDPSFCSCGNKFENKYSQYICNICNYYLTLSYSNNGKITFNKSNKYGDMVHIYCDEISFMRNRIKIDLFDVEEDIDPRKIINRAKKLLMLL